MILLPLFFLQLDCFEIYALVPGLAREEVRHMQLLLVLKLFVLNCRYFDVFFAFKLHVISICHLLLCSDFRYGAEAAE
jgi:hypothetical protein